MRASIRILLCMFLMSWHCLQYGYRSQDINGEHGLPRKALSGEAGITREIAVLVTEVSMKTPINIDRKCCRTIPGGACARDFCQVYFAVACDKTLVSRSIPYVFNIGGTNSRQLDAQFNTSMCRPTSKTVLEITVRSLENNNIFWIHTQRGLYPNMKITMDEVRSQDNSPSTASFYLGVICDNRMGEGCETLCIPIPNSVCDFRTGRLVCVPGFSGANCEIDSSDPCDTNPCLNGGTCKRIRGSSFDCLCMPGFTGINCQSNVCALDKCDHGICIVGNPACQCVDDYVGSDCDTAVCTGGIAQRNYCENNGLCNIVGNYRACFCDSAQYTGDRCEIACKSRCQNRGVCVLENSIPICSCPENLFTGEFCEMQLIQRSCVAGSNPCLNDAIDCRVNSDGSVLCVCSNSWTGPLCETQSCNSDNCLNGACVLGYGCACERNYGGPGCSVRVCSSDYCLGGGVCMTEGSINVCACESNRAGDRCQYLCAHNCGPNGVCSIDSNGTPQCLCDFDYYGPDCSNRRETIQCGILKCLNGGICLPIGKEYRCFCDSEFSGTRCELSSCNPGNCNRGVCVLGGGCECVSGYSGRGCDVETCELDSCNGNGLCQISVNQRICLCNSDFAGAGCQLRCPYGCIFGSCVYHNGELQCLCDPGFFGRGCEFKNRVREHNIGLFFTTVVLFFVAFVLATIIVLHRFVFKTKNRKSLFDQVAITTSLQVFKNESGSVDLNWEDLNTFI